MIKLRDYQIRATNELYEARRKGFKKILWVMPGGSGKSTVTAKLAKELVDHDKTMMFIVHSEELIFQFQDRLKEQFGIKSGIIMGSYPQHRHRDIQIGSVMTLINRELPDVDVVVIDEAHRAKAKSYASIIEQCPDASIIGLTATPFRADGKGLGDIFETIVHPVRVGELIQKGYLVPTKVFIPKESANMNKVDTVAGDFHKGQMYAKFNTSSLVSGVVSNYVKLAKGKKALIFNVNREHAQLTHDAFINHGLKSVYIDGETPKEERRQMVQDFKDGKIKILNSIDIFTEGFDIPDTEVIILNRATKSFGLFCQMVKRGMRPAPGKKHCIVIDHGMNHLRFCHVDDYDAIDFTLKGVKKQLKNSENKPRRCPKCHMVIKAGVDQCSNCNYRFPAPKKKKQFKNIESEGFVVYGREKSILKRIQKLKHKEVSRIPLAYLRVAEIVRGYKNGWWFHTAIDNDMIDVDKSDDDAWKLASFYCQRAEMKADTYKLYKRLRQQRKDLKKNDKYKKNPKIITM